MSYNSSFASHLATASAEALEATSSACLTFTCLDRSSHLAEAKRGLAQEGSAAPTASGGCLYWSICSTAPPNEDCPTLPRSASTNALTNFGMSSMRRPASIYATTACIEQRYLGTVWAVFLAGYFFGSAARHKQSVRLFFAEVYPVRGSTLLP